MRIEIDPDMDSIVIAEEPQLAPWREQMCETLAEALGTKRETVNVKATRAEGLGAIGEGKGIACWAVVSLKRRDSGVSRRETEDKGI